MRILGAAKGADFDPAHFDTADANRRLDAVVYTAISGSDRSGHPNLFALVSA